MCSASGVRQVIPPELHQQLSLACNARTLARNAGQHLTVRTPVMTISAWYPVRVGWLSRNMLAQSQHLSFPAGFGRSRTRVV